MFLHQGLHYLTLGPYKDTLTSNLSCLWLTNLFCMSIGVWSGAVPTGIDPIAFQCFSAVDTDRSGQITIFELQKALVNANWSNFSQDTCRTMIGALYSKKFLRIVIVLKSIYRCVNL